MSDSILIAPDTRITTGSPEWRALVHASHEWQYDTPPDDDCYHHYTQTTLCKHHPVVAPRLPASG